MEPSEGNSPSDWMRKGTCLASGCGMEEHVGGIDHCLNKLSEQHCQLTKLYVRLRLPDLQKHSDDPWGVSLSMPGEDLWYPKRGNLMLVWDVEELFSTGMLDQTQPVSILVVSVMTAVRWLEANKGMTEQQMTMPTRKQLSSVKFNHSLDLFKTTWKVLRKPKAIESKRYGRGRG